MSDRKTLTTWPTELPEGRWEWVFERPESSDWTGRFRVDDTGAIVFDDAEGDAWGAMSFGANETFVPVDGHYIPRARAPSSVVSEDPEVSTLRARVAELEGENTGLRARLATALTNPAGGTP